MGAAASSNLEKKNSKAKWRHESTIAVDDHTEKRGDKYGVPSDNSIGVDATAPNAVLGSRSLFPEMDREVPEGMILTNVPNATMAEQIAAGWPRWLVKGASEAIDGWIPRPAESFDKINKIGSGTYSNVYKAYDRQKNKVVALKKVRIDTTDIQGVKFMAREILILRKLDHQNIIKLEGLGITRMGYSLYLVFEYMAHDLSRIISKPGVQFAESEVKSYMHQLLNGIEYCHSQGVLHRDIKSSNIMIDDHGRLKIIDFGLATSYSSNTELTSRVGTLWYRSPELLLGATFYGAAVDLWSVGCVLGELYTKRPVMTGRNEVEQLHKVFKLCGTPSDDYFSKLLFHHQTSYRPNPLPRRIAEVFDSIPSAALELIETLLSVDPDHRGTATSALSSEFFTTEPIACDPSSLTGYQLSNRSNAEIVEEEPSRITDKRNDFPVQRRRIRLSGLAVTKLDHHIYKGKKIDSTSESIGGSSNVAQAIEAHEPFWKLNREAMVGEFEVHPSLLQKELQYGGVFGVSSSNMVHMHHHKNMHESDTKNWLQKFDRISFPAKSGSSSIEKRRLEESQTQEGQIIINSLLSAMKIDELLDEHDRQIQEAVEQSIVEKKMATSVGLKFVEQLHQVFKLCGTPSDDYFSKLLFHHQTSYRPNPLPRRIAEVFDSIPSAALELIETLLSLDPDHRGTATSALNSEFFTTQPIACDPSSLIGYQPSNRSNAEIVEEEPSRITDKRNDFPVQRRRIRLSGLGVTKLVIFHTLQ